MNGGQTVRRDWRDDAACRGTQPDAFFPTAAGGPAYEAQVAKAKAICADCPVRSECLAEALARIPEGIAGGLTAEERRGLTPSGRRAIVAKERVRTAHGRGETASAGLELLAGGRPARVVARLCGVSERTVTRWAARARSQQVSS